MGGLAFTVVSRYKKGPAYAGPKAQIIRKITGGGCYRI